jgi:hypothetical protein
VPITQELGKQRCHRAIGKRTEDIYAFTAAHGRSVSSARSLSMKIASHSTGGRRGDKGRVMIAGALMVCAGPCGQRLYGGFGARLGGGEPAARPRFSAFGFRSDRAGVIINRWRRELRGRGARFRPRV